MTSTLKELLFTPIGGEKLGSRLYVPQTGSKVPRLKGPLEEFVFSENYGLPDVNLPKLKSVHGRAVMLDLLALQGGNGATSSSLSNVWGWFYSLALVKDASTLCLSNGDGKETPYFLSRPAVSNSLVVAAAYALSDDDYMLIKNNKVETSAGIVQWKPLLRIPAELSLLQRSSGEKVYSHRDLQALYPML